jgi:hypothetical protein
MRVFGCAGDSSTIDLFISSLKRGVHVSSPASVLSVPLVNFGIKGKSPTGNSVNFGTHEQTAVGTPEINATCRAYESYDEAAEAYARVVTTNKAFAGALLHRTEPEKFITEVAKHYATDHMYTRARCRLP